MIKNINALDCFETLKNNNKARLIDVRTPEEWENDGYPDLSSIGKKTYFVSWGNENFLNEIKKLDFGIDETIFFICRSGSRSWHATEYLSYNIKTKKLFNVEGGIEIGWKIYSLPIKNVST
ncbi:rhodanese-like domain-containing protein [Pelagibacteraceae bacterium]|nr:rhodanese-like domain-containing protein [Pelagibacteraceae bacterium]|tara:strand:+ start:550 stop:912 length:363 start_codon:yes stop_codon:yes gene_type:complete